MTRVLRAKKNTGTIRVAHQATLPRKQVPTCTLCRKGKGNGFPLFLYTEDRPVIQLQDEERVTFEVASGGGILQAKEHREPFGEVFANLRGPRRSRNSGGAT